MTNTQYKIRKKSVTLYLTKSNLGAHDFEQLLRYYLNYRVAIITSV